MPVGGWITFNLLTNGSRAAATTSAPRRPGASWSAIITTSAGRRLLTNRVSKADP